MIDPILQAQARQLTARYLTAKHGRSKCMETGCDRPPAHECKWAEGKARAWFCADHWKSWSHRHKEDIDFDRPVEGGVVPAKWASTFKVAVQDDGGTHVGLFIRLPAELAKQFPDLGEEDDSPTHCTFLYVGDQPADPAAFVQAVQDAVADELREPIRATLDGLDYFEHPEADRRVAYAKVRFSQDMSGLRARILSRLQDIGITVKDRSPLVWHPHVTLGYLPGRDSKWEGPIPRGSWVFDTIEVWGLPEAHRIKVAAPIWYHGTPRSFDQFEVQHKHTFGTGASDTPLFFTPDKHFAKAHAGGKGTIFEVRLTWRKIFDADRLLRPSRYWPPQRESLTSEGQKLYDDLAEGRIFGGGPVSDDDWHGVFGDSQGLFASILKQDYDVIETTEFKRWLKKNGYDAAYVRGDGPANVMVFSPKQIEVVRSYPAYGKTAAVLVDLSKYTKELTEEARKVEESALRHWERSQGRKYDPKVLAEQARKWLGPHPALRGLAQGDEQAISDILLAVAKLSIETEDMDLWQQQRGFRNDLMDYSTSMEEKPEPFDDEMAQLVKETEKGARNLTRQIEAATKRVREWGGHRVLARAELPGGDSVFSPANAFYVTLGTGSMAPGFTVFMTGNRIDSIDDVLDAGDTEFFRDPELTANYFDLIRELEQPGSTTKPGKTLRLYTARPTKDRALYERSRSVPAGIYVTNDASRAYGIAHDLGGSEVRDLWEIHINEVYLIPTLVSGRTRDYQVIGKGKVPVNRMALLSEGGGRKRAKTFTLEVGDPVLVGKYLNSKGYIKEFGENDKGEPTVTVEIELASGKKKTKTVKLFRIRFDETREKRTAADPFAGMSPRLQEVFRQFTEDLMFWLGNVAVYHLNRLAKTWKQDRELREWLDQHVNLSSYTLYYGGQLTKPDVQVGQSFPRRGRVLQWTTRQKTAAWFAGIGTIGTLSWPGGFVLEARASGGQVVVDVDRFSAFCGRHRASFVKLMTKADAVAMFGGGEQYEGEVITTPAVQGKVIEVEWWGPGGRPKSRSAARPQPMTYKWEGPGPAKQRWQALTQEVARFNELFRAVRTLAKLRDEPLIHELPKPSTKALMDKLNGLELAAAEGPLSRWMVSFPTKYQRDVMSLASEIAEAANLVIRGRFDAEGWAKKWGLPIWRWVRNVEDLMEQFIQLLNKSLSQAGPEQFNYQGLQVFNPERLPDPMIKGLLDGVGYAKALFKRRGVEGVLDKSLKQILIRARNENERRVGTLGWYHPDKQAITLLADAVTATNPRMLRTWVHEILVHELGHHVHMTLLHPAGVAAWDEGWKGVQRAEAEQAVQIQKAKAVTHQERKEFWKLLVASKGNLGSIRLKGIERMKFHAWLAEPMMGSAFVTPRQLRWSNHGQNLAKFLANPEGYYRSGERDDQGNIQRHVRQHWDRLQDQLGVEDGYAPYNHPVLKDEMVEKYRKEDRSVDEALAALQLPSEYAKTNHFEDFAETWVAFMDAPEKLSDVAKYRMQKALSLSGLYGKPIMRLGAGKVTFKAQATGQGTVVRAMLGNRKIGAMTAYWTGWQNAECQDEIKALRQKYPDVEHFVLRVATAGVVDEWQGHHIGLAMYEALMTETFKRKGRPFLFMSDACFYGRSATSPAARRVWDSLARRMPSSGHVVVVTKANPLGGVQPRLASVRRVAAAWLGRVATEPRKSETFDEFWEAHSSRGKQARKPLKLEDYRLEGLMTGKPVILYHGTNREFRSFDLSKSRDELVNKFYGKGIFLTPSKKVAWQYAEANRNIGFPPEIIQDLKRVNADAGKFLELLVKHGDKAWDMEARPGLIWARAGLGDDRTGGGLDFNVIGDVAAYVLGSKVKPLGSGDPINIFDTQTGMPSWIYDSLKELHIDADKYRPRMTTVAVTVSNTLVTASPAQAKKAKQQGYECVVYHGPNLVDNIPEVAVFDPKKVRVLRSEV